MLMDTQVKNRSPKTFSFRRLALFCVSVLVVLGALFLLQYKHTSHTGLPELIAVELDADWADYFSQPHDRTEQEQYLDVTLDTLQELDANMVLLTGRVGSNALFLGKKKIPHMPQTAPAVQANSKFLNKFDPLDHLISGAKKRGLQVGLVATDQLGTQLFDSAPMPEWLEWTADHYDLPVFSPMSKNTALGCRLYTGYDHKSPELLRMDHAPSTLAAMCQTYSGSGIILGSWSSLKEDADSAHLLFSYLSSSTEVPQLLDKPVPTILGIVNPADGQKIWSDQIYLMGTSVPDGGEVTVNGQSVSYLGDRGIWGVLMPIVPGENQFSAVQGDQTCSITVKQPIPDGSGTSSTAPPEPESDGSRPAEAGQKLRVTSPLASLLQDPANPDSILMTVFENATADVAESVPLTIKGKASYAYKLQNGGYILAKDCVLLPTNSSNAAFTGASHKTEQTAEILSLQGMGTPLFTQVWEGNRLDLTFYSVDWLGQLPETFGFEGADLSFDFTDRTLTLHFQFSDADPLWGFHVEYTSLGGTQIILKHQPKRSDDPQKPLTGITVMLDPGHGGTDMGAIGSTIETFPQEKEMNLAEARAARYRLEQLGASVVMTRDDDSTLSLGDRVKLLNQTRPDFFISLHHNSSALTQDVSHLCSSESYWFYTNSKNLAQNLVSRVSTASGRPAKGPFYNYFYVTRSSLCPSVLLETGFVCSPLDYEKSTDTAVLWAEGGAVAQAVLDSIPE